MEVVCSPSLQHFYVMGFAVLQRTSSIQAYFHSIQFMPWYSLKVFEEVSHITAMWDYKLNFDVGNTLVSPEAYEGRFRWVLEIC